MQVIEEDFASFIDQFTWNDAQFPIVQNYNAHGETKAETIKNCTGE
jgi:[acyl-carrier-protein] S-malonyltransferase